LGVTGKKKVYQETENGVCSSAVLLNQEVLQALGAGGKETQTLLLYLALKVL